MGARSRWETGSAMGGYVYARVIVEGVTDKPVITELMRAAGWSDTQFNVTAVNGKGAIDTRIQKYWEAARIVPYVIFRDVDCDEGSCPVAVRSALSSKMPGESDGLLIRIVDQCIESWVLADQQGIAEFCAVSPASVKIPGSHHKAYHLRMFQEARLNNAVERVGRELDFGPAYELHLQNFMTHYWAAERAAIQSESLRRALTRLAELRERLADK